MEQQDLTKSLVELIDQTIAEIDELKKSERFAASEIKLEGPGEGIDGKDPQGSLEAKKAEAFEGEETAEEEAMEEEKKKKGAVKKGVLEEKDVKKEEDEAEEGDEEGEEEAEESDKTKKAEKDADSKMGYHLKKSEEEMNSLMKSMIDDRVKPIESKIDSILNLIKEIADTPVASKSVSYKDISPLKKSEDSTEALNKTDVASKLWDLKKSGKVVDTNDITQAELGNPVTLQKIVEKYNIK